MIKILLHTNLDDYNASMFTEEFPAVPSVGDRVFTKTEWDPILKEKNLPRSLEVVSVRWQPDQSSSNERKAIPIVELWYNDTDFKLFFPKGLENRRS